MKSKIIIDAGPIVAFLNRHDNWHEWVMKQLSEIQAPLLTCESVISEACFLLRKLRNGQGKVLELLLREFIVIPFRLENETGPVSKLMKRYKDLSIPLADACLVRMSEQYGESMIMTLDKEFRIYRKHGRQIIPTIMP